MLNKKVLGRFKSKLSNLKKTVPFIKKGLYYGFFGAAISYIGYNGSLLIHRLNERDVKDIMLSSHVTVVGQRGLGSGVIIRSDNDGSLILTNKHVCLINKRKENEFDPESEDADLIEYTPFVVVTVSDGTKYIGQTMKVSVNSDLCLLHVLSLQAKAAKLADSEPVYGDNIYNVSNPLGLGGFITKGYVGKPYYIRGTLFTHSTVIIYPGSSGSGVFNESGELVGIIARGGDPGFSFHVPLSHVKMFLESF